MVGASDRCTEGHGFDSRQELRFMLNIVSFLFPFSWFSVVVKQIMLLPCFDPVVLTKQRDLTRKKERVKVP